MLPAVMTEFTPWASLIGGVLIGVSAVMVMMLFGRIAGITGISNGALSLITPSQEKAKDWDWRIAFIAGLIVAPLLVSFTSGNIEQTVSDNVLGMALAGLLVGMGTTIGSGCTSGHGVCGLARLSTRSLAAVATFMLFAAATVFLLRHVWS
jgi:uncharacterized membrane protein YedE/YeeE